MNGYSASGAGAVWSMDPNLAMYDTDISQTHMFK